MIQLTSLIQAYIKNWDFINSEEIYKWESLKQFKESFFKTDLPIQERIRQGFSKVDNLLVSARSYPLAVLIEVAEAKPIQIETMLSNLFDESKPLRERMETYMSEFDRIIKIMKDEGHSDWKGRENVKSFQDAHAISVYLAMRYPQTHYIYQWKVFNSFASIADCETCSDAIERYLMFMQLCETVKAELMKEEAFISFYNGWLKEKKFIDPNYNLLTQDFIYAVATYLNSEEYQKAGKKKSIEKEVCQIEASAFKEVDPKDFKSFKGKIMDYEAIDKLHRNLGLEGEMWAIQYERERLEKLGINHDVRHASIEEGDGLGYDILSVEDDGVTPRYIEVKTTEGGVTQPFFYSSNELARSIVERDHYYIYRVYGFKRAARQANLLIIHGGLDELNGEPMTYKASMKHFCVG